MKFFYPLISEFHNVLSSDECKNIIDFCQKDFTELTVIVKESDNGIKFRVGQGAWINKPIYDKNKIDLNLSRL